MALRFAEPIEQQQPEQTPAPETVSNFRIVDAAPQQSLSVLHDPTELLEGIDPFTRQAIRNVWSNEEEAKSRVSAYIANSRGLDYDFIQKNYDVVANEFGLKGNNATAHYTQLVQRTSNQWQTIKRWERSPNGIVPGSIIQKSIPLVRSDIEILAGTGKLTGHLKAVLAGAEQTYYSTASGFNRLLDNLAEVAEVAKGERGGYFGEASEFWQDWAKKRQSDWAIPQEIQQSVSGQIASGIGQLPVYAMFASTGVAGSVALTSAMYEEAGTRYDELVPKEQQSALGKVGFSLSYALIAAKLEKVGFDAMLGRLFRGSSGPLSLRQLVQISMATGTETGTEILQQMLLNAESLAVDPDKASFTDGLQLKDLLVISAVSAFGSTAGHVTPAVVESFTKSFRPSPLTIDGSSPTAEMLRSEADKVGIKTLEDVHEEGDPRRDLIRPMVSDNAQEAQQAELDMAEATLPTLDPRLPVQVDVPKTPSEIPKVVGLNKRLMAELRPKLGFDQLPQSSRLKNEQFLAQALEQEMQKQAETIAAEVVRSPRAITPVEYMGLQVREVELVNEYQDMVRKSSDAAVAGNKEESRSYANRALAVLDRIDMLQKASKLAGSETSDAMRVRQSGIHRDTFSLANVTALAQSHKGEALTPSEMAMFEKLVSKLQQQDKKVQDLIRKRIDEYNDQNVPEWLKTKILEALTGQYRQRVKIQKEINKYKQRTWIETARDIAALPRTLIATADLSATLRQGLLISAGHPSAALEAFQQSVRAAFDENTASEIYVAIQNHVNAPIWKKAGLYITPIDRIELAEREEAFASSLGEKIPIYRHVVLASERHMVTHLNLLRVAAFNSFIENHPEATLEEQKAYASYVNAATGRGSLGKFESATQNLSFVFFSPRFMVSRFQAPLALLRNWNSPVVRNEIAKDFGAMLGTGGIVLMLAAAAGAEVGLDPEKSDFGKIIIGNTRIDLWAGFQQPARLTMLYALKTADTTGIRELGRDVDLVYATMKFGQYKLSPAITIPLELVQGKNAIGEEVHPGQTFIRNTVPLMLQDTVDVLNSDNPEKAAIVFPLAILGAGISEQD